MGISKKPFITVVITRSYETDELVEQCCLSLSKQKNVDALVLFLDQRKSETLQKFIYSINSAPIFFKYIQIPAKSLSFARNYGLEMTRTRLVAFCDIDCILEENWLNEIVTTFNLESASIVGTKILPVWGGKTRWYHKSKFIQEFYSLLNVAPSRCELPKVIGASFAVDKKELNGMLFDERLGRKEGNFLGGEETDLCQRVRKKDGKVIYTPFTHANHQVSAKRLTLKWLLMKAYSGGISRAIRGGASEPFNKEYNLLDRCAILLISPFYLFGLLRGRLFR